MKLTPRTDSSWIDWVKNGDASKLITECKLLELELMDAKEKVEQLERERDHANDTASAVLKENAALAERVRRLEKAGDEVAHSMNMNAGFPEWDSTHWRCGC